MKLVINALYRVASIMPGCHADRYYDKSVVTASGFGLHVGYVVSPDGQLKTFAGRGKIDTARRHAYLVRWAALDQWLQRASESELLQVEAKELRDRMCPDHLLIKVIRDRLNARQKMKQRLASA